MITNGSWRADALCAQTDPEVLFPEGAHTPRPALRVCADCPVSTECLEYVLNEPLIRDGVWGGLVMRDIVRMRRVMETGILSASTETVRRSTAATPLVPKKCTEITFEFTALSTGKVANKASRRRASSSTRKGQRHGENSADQTRVLG